MSSSGKPTVSRARRKRLRRWALILICLYISGAGLLWIFEDRLIYRRATAVESWHEPRSLDHIDVFLPTSYGTVHGWWCSVPEPKGALIYCPGQSGNLSHRTSRIKLFQRLGCSVLIIDYPGYGKSTGMPSEAGCYAAASAAYQWLTTEKGVPQDRIIILGKSLGGGPAVELAGRVPHRALILIKTYSSLPAVCQRLVPIYPVHLMMTNRFDNLSKIEHCTAPVFLAHGTDDWKIPHSHSEKLHRKIRQSKELFLMTGVPHGDPSLTNEAIAAIQKFLNSHAPLP